MISASSPNTRRVAQSTRIDRKYKKL
jgi:hypothetical protein